MTNAEYATRFPHVDPDLFADRRGAPPALSTPIIQFGSASGANTGHATNRDNVWRLEDAVRGVQVFGETGSGKTTASGAIIARRYLELGFGGLVLCGKQSELKLWESYCQETGRLDDLLAIDMDVEHGMNILQYERLSGGLNETVVELLSTVMKLFEREARGGGQNRFWEQAARQLLRNVITLQWLAEDQVTIEGLRQLVLSAPTDLQQLSSPDWRSETRFGQVLAAIANRDHQGHYCDFDRRDYAATDRYFLGNFLNLALETRSGIIAHFDVMADVMDRFPLRELFSDRLNFVPEVTFAGRVVVVNLPVRELNEIGTIAQVLMKYLWQRAVERRRVVLGQTWPVFLWADESQLFLIDRDRDYQATCRSALGCTVYLTQNLPQYHSVLPDANHAAVNSLLGNFATKIFHLNSCPQTNDYASNLIGKTLQRHNSGGANFSATGGTGMSAGFSEQLDHEVPPRVFTQLRSGGPNQDWQVDALVYQTGRAFNVPGVGQRPYLHVTFHQRKGASR